MKRAHTVVPLITLTLASNTYAAEAFEDEVPAIVVEQLISSMYGGQAELYADIVADFPAFEIPQGMEVLASLHQAYAQRVILSSRFDHAASSALAYSALMNSGWQLVPAYMPQPQSGFVNPNQPVPPTQLCHDEHGIMNVSVMGGLDATYVHITRNITPPGAPPQNIDCATGVPQQFNDRVVARPPMLDIQQYVPRLVLPTSDGMSAPMGGYGGGGGGPNEWETRATLTGTWDIERVFDHFAEQMTDQGWERDADVAGDRMASGSWTKKEGDVELTGNLTVLTVGEEAYDLRLRILIIGGTDAQAVGGMRFVPGPQLGIRGIPTTTAIGASIIVRDAPAAARRVPFDVQGNGEAPPAD